jgi:CO/xanthine dehydrogenase Mo-binding subunit
VPSGRQLSFGEAAKVAATLEIALTDHMELRFNVGKPIPVVDLDPIVRGKATYGIDVTIPGMKYASVEHCPVYGGKALHFDAADALKVPGVEQIVEIPATPIPSGFYPLGGIAVIASNAWLAQQGRQKLKITWDFGPNANHDSTAYRAELEATSKQPGRAVRNQGDVDAALDAAEHRISADYFVPYYAHAPMEVPNAVAHFVDGKCEIWTPTQFPQSARTTHAFAVCSFADELAHAAGKDPLEYLRQLLGEPRKLDFVAMHVDYPNYGASLDMHPVDTARLRGVLDLVARNSEWGSLLPPRHGRGIAVHRSFLSYEAAVVQVASAPTGRSRSQGSTSGSIAASSSIRTACAYNSKAP